MHHFNFKFACILFVLMACSKKGTAPAESIPKPPPIEDKNIASLHIAEVSQTKTNTWSVGGEHFQVDLAKDFAKKEGPSKGISLTFVNSSQKSITFILVPKKCTATGQRETATGLDSYTCGTNHYQIGSEDPTIILDIVSDLSSSDLESIINTVEAVSQT